MQSIAAATAATSAAASPAVAQSLGTTLWERLVGHADGSELGLPLNEEGGGGGSGSTYCVIA